MANRRFHLDQRLVESEDRFNLVDFGLRGECFGIEQFEEGASAQLVTLARQSEFFLSPLRVLQLQLNGLVRCVEVMDGLIGVLGAAETRRQWAWLPDPCQGAGKRTVTTQRGTLWQLPRISLWV